jgi:hypothetical protein
VKNAVFWRSRVTEMPPKPTSHLATKSFMRVDHGALMNSTSTPSALAADCTMSMSMPS